MQRLRFFIAFFSMVYAVDITAQEEEEKNRHSDEHLEQVSQGTSHPATNHSFVIIENETVFFEDDELENEPENKLFIRPIIGQPIFNNSWTWATRIDLEFASIPLLHGEHGEDRVNGFGDLGVTMFLAPSTKHDGFIWAMGYSSLFPTASEDELGAGKYQLGPAISLFYLGPEFGTGLRSFNLGTFVEHLWSVGGDDDFEDSNRSNIHYYLMYRLTSTMQIGMEPRITIDWEEESGNRLNFPIGLGIGDLFNMGKLPVKWRVEGQYFVASEEVEARNYSVVLTLEPIISSLFHTGH